MAKKKSKKGKEIKKEMTADEIDSLPADIQRERGHQLGQIAGMEEELEELREKLKGSREKEEVAKFLQQKDEELRLKEMEGILSLRNLFSILEKSKKGIIKKISLLSYNKKTLFGKLHDISLNPDGRIGVWVKENGFPKQIISGSTLRNIFWDYEGLINSANYGIFTLSLNEVGEYVENPLMEEVPSIIVDANGKYNVSHIDRKKLIAWLIDKEREINSLYRYLEMAERALSKVGHEVNLTKLLAKLNIERRKTAETVLTKSLKDSNEIVKNWKEIEGELVDKSHQLYIKNREVEALEGVREKITKKLESVESGTSVDIAKQEILSYVDFLVGLIQGKKVSFAKTPEEIEMTPLKKKFDRWTSKPKSEEQ